MKKRSGLHYCWIIAAVIFLQMLIYGGTVNNLSGYHIIPVSEALGVGRTEFSIAISLRAVTCAVSALFSGLLIRRFGYRRIVPVGLAFAGLSYLLMSFTQNYPMLIACCILSGVPDGLCLIAAATILVNQWFRKHRGVVMGAATAATGIGSTLLGYVQTPIIAKVSWRLSFAVVAGLLLLTALVVVILVRNRPEDKKLRPYGEAVSEKRRKNWAPVGLPMRVLQKQPAFYMLAVFAMLSCFCVLLVSYNLVPYFQDEGFSEDQANRLFGIMMFLLGFVKLAMGALCDRIGTKKVAVGCHLACALGVLLILLLPKKEPAMIAALLVFSLAMPMSTIIFPLLSAELLGYLDQGRYIGIIMAMVSTASVLSGPIANIAFERFKSYTPVFWVSVFMSVIMAALYGVLYAISARMLKKGKVREPAK